jgi:hypothetical protein
MHVRIEQQRILTQKVGTLVHARQTFRLKIHPRQE